MKFTILSLLFSLLFGLVSSYKILYLLPFCTQSHRNSFDPLIYELASRNHRVTVVSPYTAPQPHENIRDIVTMMPLDRTSYSKNVVDTFGNSVFKYFHSFKYVVAAACEGYLQNSEVKELLKRGQQFDVVIVDAILNEFALATAPLLGKHIVMHSSSSHIPWTGHFMPQPPSYVPFMLIPLGSKMNFFQRFENTITFLVCQLLYKYDHIPSIQKTIGKYLPENPSIIDANAKVALTLANGDPVMDGSRPSYPTVISVGGIHTKEGKPLPKDLQDFIQNAGDEGFIVFSLGSNMQSKDIPEEMKKGILKAFSRLKQNVIWKYEEKFENLPKNVLVTKWLPQMDVLAHPKIRLFITHGGLLSLQESIFNGVPLVAVPLTAEQPGNVARVEEIGIALKLQFFSITEETMYDAINKVLSDKSFSENAKKYREIFREHKKGKLKSAADWVEYVVRFNGAQHLKSAGEELNFIQYFLIDVAAFISAVICVLAFIAYKLFKKICYCKPTGKTCSKKKSNTKKERK